MASSLAHQESVMLKSKGHSLFTFYLLEGLIGGGGKSVDEEGNVTPSSLGDYIDEQILGLHLGSRIDQRPILKTETSGKFILADHPKLAKKPTVPAMELNQLMTDGNQYFQDKKYHAAIEKFDEVLTLDEKHYFAYKLKGDAFMEWIKPNEALECYDKALEIKPDYLFALRGKGLAYYKLSKYNQAIECYDRALKINSKDSVTLNYKGLSYMHLEKYNDALHYFNGALELDPTYHEALRNKQKCEEIISKRRDNLLYDINEKNLIPVIGNRASSPFLPIKSEIADEWAREYDYPFEDSQKLEKESEGNI
jgi:tetratricopeptide (TPR) repeat protein